MGSRRQTASLLEVGQQPGPAGFALPAALLMVLLIAALIAGVSTGVTEETRMGKATADRQIALLAAESAIEDALTSSSPIADGSLSVGETRSQPMEGLGVRVVVHVTRLDSTLYWLVADAGGSSHVSGIARRIGIVVRGRSRPDRSLTIDRIPEGAWSELF